MTAIDRVAPTTARIISENEFWNMSAEWRSLLERSNADRLFMSWEWLSAWWETWSRSLELDLLLVGVFQGDRLIGLAPWFCYKRTICNSLAVKEIHFLGNAWHIAPTVRTEYVDLIVESESSEAVLDELSYFLKERRWDLLVLCDHAPSLSKSQFTRLYEKLRLKAAPRSSDVGVSINTTGVFEHWLAGLGKQTRLKAYNRRRYLADQGRAARLYYEHDKGNAMELLNEFHRARWDKPCFHGKSLEFHYRFLGRLNESGATRFSVMKIDGKIRSILYDLKVGGGIYNLQAGFEENYDRKMSLGTLHLGYAIEEAFRDPGINFYDLLAGEGKNTFYKAHLNGGRVYFQTGQYLHSTWLKAAGSVYQMLPRRISRQMVRWLDSPSSGRL